MDKKEVNREEIVAEYLTCNISYRALEKKYGVPSRSICDWVLKYQGRLPSWSEKENTSGQAGEKEKKNEEKKN